MLEHLAESAELSIAYWLTKFLEIFALTEIGSDLEM
jgi:hypothetical protein